MGDHEGERRPNGGRVDRERGGGLTLREDLHRADDQGAQGLGRRVPAEDTGGLTLGEAIGHEGPGAPHTGRQSGRAVGGQREPELVGMHQPQDADALTDSGAAGLDEACEALGGGQFRRRVGGLEHGLDPRHDGLQHGVQRGEVAEQRAAGEADLGRERAGAHGGDAPFGDDAERGVGQLGAANLRRLASLAHGEESN